MEAESCDEDDGRPLENGWRPGGIAGRQVHIEKGMDAVENVYLSSDSRSQYTVLQEVHWTRSEDGKQSVHGPVIQLKSWHQRYPREAISKKQTHVVT